MPSFEQQMMAFLQGTWVMFWPDGSKHETLTLAGNRWAMNIKSTGGSKYLGAWTVYQIDPQAAPSYGGAGYAIQLTADSFDPGITMAGLKFAADMLGSFGGPWGKAAALGNRFVHWRGRRAAEQEIQEGLYWYFVLHSWEQDAVVVANVNKPAELLTWRRMQR